MRFSRSKIVHTFTFDIFKKNIGKRLLSDVFVFYGYSVPSVVFFVTRVLVPSFGLIVPSAS